MDYKTKFESFKGRTLYGRLDTDAREYVRSIAFACRLTFQEFRQVVEAERDLSMWQAGSVRDTWTPQVATAADPVAAKKLFLVRLRQRLDRLRAEPSAYAGGPPARGPAEDAPQRERRRMVTKRSDKTVHGMCPVASEKTVCCNLRTIDAVENCVFGCSYCTVQTFYGRDVVFDADFAAKLRAIPIDPDRFYHFGTGQASDSLAFGNREGVLDALCEFAADHPNILLELKTKSDNTRYFMKTDVPANIVCSWSLNTPAVIRNEEHFTASLERRLDAARRVADRGGKVAFHFHPMVYYEGWDADYNSTIAALTATFDPDEVLFVSAGSVTLIKPVLKKIRELGNPTKMTQIDFVTDPHGKLTYPDDVKIAMFRLWHESLAPWRGRVFTYLCMEKADIWRSVFGRVYGSNTGFERDFGQATMAKIAGSRRFCV